MSRVFSFDCTLAPDVVFRAYITFFLHPRLLRGLHPGDVTRRLKPVSFETVSSTVDPLRLLHTTPTIREAHGGPARSVPYLCNALAAQGGHVHLVTGVPAKRSDAIVPSSDVKLHALPDTGGATGFLRRPVTFYQEVRGVIANHAPDIVHDHGLWLPLHGAVALAARQQSVPIVLSPKGMAMPWALRYKRWKKRLTWWGYQRWIMQQAALFHATSAAEVEALRALGLKQPIAMVSHGVDIPDALPAPQQNTDRTALFLSRLHPKKGLPMLLDGWAALQPEGWRLVLVGPDELGHRAELEKQVRRLGLEPVVQFEGPVPDADKWQWYADADLFILPTYSENFGIVVPEALAAGTPALTTTGAPWQDLETHACGWSVEPTTDAIQSALGEALACSDEERASMGQRGRRLVEEKYTWASVGEQVVAAYQWLLGRGSRPACVQLSE